MSLSGFRNRERALANLALLAPDLPFEIQTRMAFLVSACADPDAALHYLVRFQQERTEDLRRIATTPNLLLPLVTLFAHSRFLSEELLQHPEWLDATVNRADFHRVVSSETFESELNDYLAARNQGILSALHLAQFRRLQILRILLRDVTGLATLAETTLELSNLADAILNVTYGRIRADLVKRHGEPRQPDGARCGLSIIALGKLGGQELNYSSDIDLMFLYSSKGETDGERSISNQEFFKKVANHYTEVLSTYTPEGMCYRVDLRLRPDGKLGEVCVSGEGARQYYSNRARDWELQMLIKARVAAGERGPGQDLLDFVEPSIYSTTLDFSAVEAVSEARERIQEKLQQRRGKSGAELDIKLARGGIRDIEFLVQCLQRLHGGREPWVRHGGTLLALFRLRDKNLLSDVEYSRLAEAYQFLRHLEHRLQVEDDRQTHTLPRDPEALQVLAQRMPAAELGSEASVDQLRRQVEVHTCAVREIYERVIHAQQPMYYYGAAARLVEGDRVIITDPELLRDPDSNLIRFFDQKAPNLAAVLNRMPARRNGKALERFLEFVTPHAEQLYWLDSDPVLAGYIVDIFENSLFFAEQLIRFPEMLAELKRIREQPGLDTSIQDLESLDDANDLRRFFRREMFRIEAESICLRTPVFKTLQRTSALAEAAITAVYRLAVAEALASHPPHHSSYRPSQQMMVVSLGRLGMREFDMGSDADLVFVLPDEDAAEQAFWTKVATRIIDRLSAYTREGVIFAVDTRLRPNGREGELVQTEAAYKEYFSSRAEAWEGITYLKARALAGNVERGTEFLNQLQELDWRRYGQSGRSVKQLRQMRMRLEKEQGAENLLKAGRGGFYDIDFALMYLRLKGAGIFYKVLNTPERIDVIEKMGHLERSDAAFIRDAAIFYRSLDHGLRILSGHVEGFLPKSNAQMEMLHELVSRWTPDHLHDQPLEQELAQIQDRTREFFDRLFPA